MFAMASGYVMKSKLGPESMKILQNIQGDQARVWSFTRFSLVCLLTFILGNVLNLHLSHLCHVAQHREDNKPRHEAGQAVHQAGHNGITVEEEI